MQLVKGKTVAARLKIKLSTLRRFAKNGLFPKPRLVNGMERWDALEVEFFIRGIKPVHRYAAGELPPPPVLLDGGPLPECLRDLTPCIQEWKWTMPCVYFLVKGDAVIYVGQTCNLGGRLASHRKDKDFDRVFFLPCAIEELLRAESFYIMRYQPACNGTLKDQAEADNGGRSRASRRSPNRQGSRLVNPATETPGPNGRLSEAIQGGEGDPMA